MHENILHFVESSEQPNQFSNGYPSYLQDISPKLPAAVQSIPAQARANTPENDNQLQSFGDVSPILPGTGSITHNVTRMLNDSEQLYNNQLPVTASRAERYSPYSTAHCLSFRQRVLNQNNRITQGKDESQERVTNNTDDMSISTEGSVCLNESSINSSRDSFESLPLSDAPSSAETSPLNVTPPSIKTSPISGIEVTSSSSSSTNSINHVDNDDKPKKSARTNYTNEQIQTLLKIFHETPYPDSEMMENIGKDLDIPEKKVKIWFQNKRARWRRRVNDNAKSHVQPFIPVSPVTPYGYMPTAHMVTSSPIPSMGSYYHWMQGSMSPNNNQRLPGQYYANQLPPHFQGSNHTAALQNHAFPAVPNMASFVPTLSSAQYTGTLSQQNMTSNQTRHSLQYPTQMYTSHIHPTC